MNTVHIQDYTLSVKRIALNNAYNASVLVGDWTGVP